MHRQHLAPVVARSVYRSLMRLSDKGAHPEVIPWRALPDAREALLAGYHSPSNFLRHSFLAASKWQRRQANADEDWSDPFVVLRHAAALKQALRPADVPELLPALTEHGRCILPGEKCRFVMWSAKDVLLAQVAAESGGRFVHVADSPGSTVGSVLSIQSAKLLPFGRIVLDCIAGPRRRIEARRLTAVDVETRGEEIQDYVGGRSTRRDAQEEVLHVVTSTCVDDPVVCTHDASATEALRRELSARLLQPSCSRALQIVGIVPPLHCAERLSFFLCGLVLRGDDVRRRLAVMATRSTQRRLEFCSVGLDAWMESRTADGGREEHRPRTGDTWVAPPCAEVAAGEASPPLTTLTPDEPAQSSTGGGTRSEEAPQAASRRHSDDRLHARCPFTQYVIYAEAYPSSDSPAASWASCFERRSAELCPRRHGTPGPGSGTGYAYGFTRYGGGVAT